MKDYEKMVNCNDTYCEYFDTRMELNCAYSEDNSECIKTIEPHLPKADAYSLLADVRAWLRQNAREPPHLIAALRQTAVMCSCGLWNENV